MDVDASRGLLRYLKDVPDPRAANVSHSLYNMLVIALLAVLCSCDDWEEIAAWAAANRDWLATFLDLPHGTPSHDTFDRVFARVDPLALERCLIAFTAAVADASEGRLLAVDGKRIRRSFDHGGRKAAIHMINAWDQHNELVLGQLATDDKSNEITAIPKLLELLDVRGCVVSIDAMGCQQQIARKIVDGGGDYLLAVKGNQKELHEHVKFFFDESITEGWEGMEPITRRSTDADHGRLETRRLWASHEVDWLEQQGQHWPKLGGLVCVEGERQVFGTDRTTRERRYFITSLDPRRVGGERLLAAVRGHWGVENKVHWSLDVSFREDQSRVRKGHGAQNLSRMRRLAMNLLRPRRGLNDPPGRKKKPSIKIKRLMCSWDRDYLLQTLTAS